MSQVAPFESVIKNNNINIDKMIHINIDKEIAVQRITGRLVCEKCNHIFNKYVDNVSDVCPLCNGNLYTRSDDNIETYNNRYNVYINETYPVYEYYKDKISTYEIENNGTIDDIYDKINHIMKDDLNDNN